MMKKTKLIRGGIMALFVLAALLLPELMKLTGDSKSSVVDAM